MRRKTIVVADDDNDILEAISLILESDGYEVKTVNNGGEILKWNRELPDLFLLDLWMSGVSGKDLCLYLKKQKTTKRIPVLFISANRDVVQLTTECGADGYISKPFEMDDLLATIKSYLPD